MAVGAPAVPLAGRRGCEAVTAQAFAAPQRAELADLADLLADDGFRMTMIATSRDPNAKVTVLLTPRGGDRDALVLKVPTTAAAARAIAREAATLRALHRLSSPQIEVTVPHVVGTVASRRGDALVTTRARGTPMTTGYHRWRHTRSSVDVGRDLGAVAAWLQALHSETATDVAPVEMDGGVIDRLRLRFAMEPDLRAVVGGVAAARARLRAQRAPRTVVHGDLWCGNVLIESNAVTGVVDWEEATTSGEPLRDIVRFALTYALYLDRHTRPGRAVRGHPGLRATEWGAGITYLLEGEGWMCDLLRSFVRLGMRRLGVPGNLWYEALIAGIAEIAARADDPTFAGRHFTILRRAVTRESR